MIAPETPKGEKGGQLRPLLRWFYRACAFPGRGLKAYCAFMPRGHVDKIDILRLLNKLRWVCRYPEWALERSCVVSSSAHVNSTVSMRCNWRLCLSRHCIGAYWCIGRRRRRFNMEMKYLGVLPWYKGVPIAGGLPFVGVTTASRVVGSYPSSHEIYCNVFYG